LVAVLIFIEVGIQQMSLVSERVVGVDQVPIENSRAWVGWRMEMDRIRRNRRLEGFIWMVKKRGKII